MKENHPILPWCRYADDGLVHCNSEAQAQEILRQLHERFAVCGVELHPDKTKIVYCKDAYRPKRYANTTLCKYKKLKGHKTRACQFIEKVAKQTPHLFVHWKIGVLGMGV